MARYKRDTLSTLKTMAGNYRSPSTLGVISMVHGMDVALRKAEYLFEDYEERQARAARRTEDCEALCEQIGWLSDSMDAAPTDAEKSRLAELAEYLLSLQKEVLEESRLDKPKRAPPPTVGQMLYVPVTYALSLFRNTVLLVLFWIALVLVVIAIIRVI